MKRRASFYLFISALLGIFLSHSLALEPSAYAFAAFMPFTLLVVFNSHLARVINFLLLLSLLSACSFSYAVRSYLLQQRSISEEEAIYEGEVSDWWRTFDGSLKLRSHIKRSDSVAPLYHVQLSLVGPAAGLKPRVGTPFRIRGSLIAMQKPLSPVHFDAFRYGLSHQIHGSMVLRDPRLIWLGVAPSGISIKTLRQALRERIFAALSPHQASLLLALIIGDTSLFSADQKESYQAIGAQHLLAVSGLQVALIAALGFFILRLFFASLLPSPGKHKAHLWAALLTLILLWLFIALTLWPRSAVRAGLMGTASLVPLMIGRSHNSFDAFFLSAFIALLIDPLSVLDIGFLLSYAAVFALILVQHHSRALRSQLKAHSLLVLFIFSSLLASLAAFLATLPVILIFFGTFAPWSTFANWPLVPLVSLLQVPAIIAGLVGALLQSEFILRAGALCAQVIEILVQSVSAVFGGQSFIPALSNLSILLGSLAPLVLLLALLKNNLRLCLAALALLVLPLKELLYSGSKVLEARVMAVGQGDATLFSLPSGQHFLIDAGGQPYGSFDPGLAIVLPRLKRLGIKELDILLITHPDPDHVLGAFALIDAIPIKELWHSGFKPDHPLTERLLRAARAKNISVKDAHDLRGTHTFGETHLEVLAPKSEGPLPFHEALSANDNSLVVRLIHEGQALLWPGDIERLGEKMLLESGQDIRATILKAPHHGSKTSSSQALIDAVDPRYVIYSTGHHNRFGHPHAQIKERYDARKVKSYNTALDGEISIRIENGEVSIKGFREGVMGG